ncbi:hypothetical protein PHPALM_31644 [Phytophthora palmivora]|uniref:HTH CENPB-type domain-containing protein n=1 Tax=Phytophthora palmivora TaxID=4796 RepID=A0A2P4X233_9STRA|nr:hypothetical protein PHPALM_31644 [Phytophthora palmivora]
MSHLELYNHRNLQNASKNRLVTTRSARRLGRGGRAPKYPELEERLHVWVLHRNSKGLRAKDNYLRLQAQNNYHNLHGPAAPTFDAATGISAQIYRLFIQRIHQLVAVHSINHTTSSIWTKCLGTLKRNQKDNNHNTRIMRGTTT